MGARELGKNSKTKMRKYAIYQNTTVTAPKYSVNFYKVQKAPKKKEKKRLALQDLIIQPNL